MKSILRSCTAMTLCCFVAGQASAVCVAMLLIPVYTYEHHLVWALPAAVLAVLAASAGRLPLILAVVAGLSTTLLAFDLQALKQLFMEIESHWPGVFVQELKFLSLCGLLLCSAWVGRGVGRP